MEKVSEMQNKPDNYNMTPNARHEVRREKGLT
jgi:hypothetical protein